MSAIPSKLIRLNKLLASKGFGSRREADALVKQGFVRVNGQKAETAGLRVDPATAVLQVDPAGLTERTTVILHKPLGVVSCQPEREDQRPAIKLLTDENYHLKGEFRGKEPYRLPKMAVAGRLDVNSTGLLVITQSGKIASQIIGPDSALEKEYLVRIKNDPKNKINLMADTDEIRERLEKLREGIESDGDLLQLKDVSVLNEDQLKVVLLHGRKHHVRRMLDAVGWGVKALKRVRIGNLKLGNLAKGQWRLMGPEESIVPPVVEKKRNRQQSPRRQSRRNSFDRRRDGERS